MNKTITLIVLLFPFLVSAQVEYFMPEEIEAHEGTWLQWPHNNLYGPWFIEDVEPTFILMTSALQSSESVHIVATDSTELMRIMSVLNGASIPMDNIDFFVHPTDDVWIRDNGPMLSLIHISEPTRQEAISYAVFCLKKKKS